MNGLLGCLVWFGSLLVNDLYRIQSDDEVGKGSMNTKKKKRGNT